MRFIVPESVLCVVLANNSSYCYNLIKITIKFSWHNKAIRRTPNKQALKNTLTKMDGENDMQHRMKTHPLTKDQIDNLLFQTQTGCLATLNTNGAPYVTPVHFLYLNNEIYIHGLPKGQKIDNIKVNSSVSMAVYEMGCLLFDPDDKPCDTNTKYQSVIIVGTAVILEDMEHKKKILNGIVQKYTPHLTDKHLPENMLKGTAVIKIDILDITGKYYD